jgi:hypothetical protein
MDEFGRFRLIYEPGEPNPDSGIFDHSVEMAISGEADLHQLLVLFEQFLKATGYLIDGNLVQIER